MKEHISNNTFLDFGTKPVWAKLSGSSYINVVAIHRVHPDNEIAAQTGVLTGLSFSCRRGLRQRQKIWNRSINHFLLVPQGIN